MGLFYQSAMIYFRQYRTHISDEYSKAMSFRYIRLFQMMLATVVPTYDTLVSTSHLMVTILTNSKENIVVEAEV